MCRILTSKELKPIAWPLEHITGRRRKRKEQPATEPRGENAVDCVSSFGYSSRAGLFLACWLGAFSDSSGGIKW